MRLQLHGSKMIHHLDTLVKWRRNEIFPPLLIEFGPVSGCNHRCLPCYVQDHNRKIELMKEEVYLRFMAEIGRYGVKAVVLAGCGEPLLHKATIRAIELAKKNGTDVGMFTNGVLIRPENMEGLLKNLTFIRFTINGCSQDSYPKAHGCSSRDWEKVISNIEDLLSLKKKMKSNCTIGVYTLLLGENVAEVESWAERLKQMKVDYLILKPPEVSLDNIQFARIVVMDQAKPILERIAKLNSPDFTVEIRWDLFKEGCVKDYKRCLGLPFMCAVDADGSVYSCNWHWKKDDFKYGDLNTQTFKEIWESRRKKEIMDKITSADFDLGQCGLCRQNSINRFLWEICNPPEHVNFI